jgi:hypothetical protein
MKIYYFNCIFIDEFYRKKQKSISQVPLDQRVDTLIKFWEESLNSYKILNKLKFKEQTGK